MLCRYCNGTHCLYSVCDPNSLLYCPDDLFSGDLARIAKAISALVNQPRNNFKLFCNGQNLYPSALTVELRKRIELFLVQDPFIMKLKNALHTSWSLVYDLNRQSAIDNEDLTNAFVLQDCSFIIQLFPDGKVAVKLIDLDTKPDYKIPIYLKEVNEGKKLLISQVKDQQQAK